MRRLVWGRHPFEPIGHQMLYTNVSAGRYFLYIGLLEYFVSRFAPEYPIIELSRTYHGREDMQSLTLLNKLDHLGELLNEALARDDEDSQKLIRVLNGTENALPPNATFTVEFEAFLHDFGHRGPREMELAAPSWRESPATLLKILQNAKPASVKANTAHGEHLAARDELHRYLKPWQRYLVDRIRRKISKFIALRENTRHYHIMAFDLVRQKILQVETELLRDEKLSVPGDIFFLRHLEMEQLTDGRLEPTSAHELIRMRRRDWQRQTRAPIEETINVTLPQVDVDETSMRGQCACPGWVEGTARVIHSLSQADTLNHGEILVAPYTDPAWTPLFTRAAGIVIGTGSFLSHAATVARELHVPCIVDVKNCMHQINSGQKLKLDATSGTVEIVA
jgi:phosphohistidine swiveling domain-containing protein